MESLVNFALKEKYARVKKLRSRLDDMNKLIEWDKFVGLFPERKSQVGRPNYEKILLLKMMFLQGWYGLSDEELEFQINDRLSFQQFLDFPNIHFLRNLLWLATLFHFLLPYPIFPAHQNDQVDALWDSL